MQTSSYFGIGASHLICQDYAIAGPRHVILSDGCSNGGGANIHTDFGSRLLVKAAEEHLGKIKSLTNFCSAVSGTAQTQQRSFPNLPPECLTATLLVIWDDPFLPNINSLLIGDGLIAARQKQTKLWEIHNFEFLAGGKYRQSAPFYLYYDMIGKRNEYFEKFGHMARCHSYVGDFKSPDDAEQLEFDYERDIDLQEDGPYFYINFSKEEYDVVVGMTDGISSFYKIDKTETSKSKVNLPPLHVLPYLLDFPDFNLRFVERVCQWVFKTDKPQTFLRMGWHNSDDFSMGAIHNA